MREFKGHEYVDGDVRIYVKVENTEHSWEEVGLVRFGESRQVEEVAKRLGLTDMNSTELARLSDELAMPRRW